MLLCFALKFEECSKLCCCFWENWFSTPSDATLADIYGTRVIALLPFIVFCLQSVPIKAFKINWWIIFYSKDSKNAQWTGLKIPLRWYPKYFYPFSSVKDKTPKVLHMYVINEYLMAWGTVENSIFDSSSWKVPRFILQAKADRITKRDMRLSQ